MRDLEKNKLTLLLKIYYDSYIKYQVISIQAKCHWFHLNIYYINLIHPWKQLSDTFIDILHIRKLSSIEVKYDTQDLRRS